MRGQLLLALFAVVMLAVAGWRSLAVIIDAYSRRMVGWAMAAQLRTELVLDALAMSRQARRPSPGLVHHTDRGGQYTAADQAALAARGLVCLLRRAGECRDNTLAERCCATLQAARVDARTWPTRAATRPALFAWLVVWYSRLRRHSALGYRTPVADEEPLLLQDLAA